MLLLPSGATAATTTANLRVVNTANTVLADQSQVTGDVALKTETGTDCFGGTSTGATYTIPGPTALGIVKDSSETNPALRPLLFTDSSYPAFGIGLCGVGGFLPTSSGFWYLKVNHAGATVSGSQLSLNNGDEVLWYLASTFPPPDELQLIAPTVAQAGKPFTVTVFSYDDSGRRSPVPGALVTGADLPTAGDGTTTVELSRSVVLRALHEVDIPSNQEIVCVLTSKDTCGGVRHRISGTNGRDRIRGTKDPDQIRARGGDDRVNTNGGLPDIANCGGGKDRAIIGPNDVARKCERVIRKR
jgi:RTX calcium-binding nonapeptide repeat (4 copies)